MASRVAPTIPIDDIVQLIARTVGSDKSKEVVSGAANLVGVSAADLTPDQARRILDTLATIPGLVGAAARFARKRLGLADNVEPATVGTSNPPSSAPGSSVAPLGRRTGMPGVVGLGTVSAGSRSGHDGSFGAKPTAPREDASRGGTGRSSDSPPENRRPSTAKGADLRRTTGPEFAVERRGAGPESGKEPRVGAPESGGRDLRRITGTFDGGAVESELRRGPGAAPSNGDGRRTGSVRVPDENEPEPESTRTPPPYARSSTSISAVVAPARLPRSDLVALLAHSLGREKGDELVTAAARRLNLDAGAFNRDEALKILGDLAGTPGIVGVTAKFAKARAVLRFPS